MPKHIFITGSTGFIAILEAGHRVRLSIRKPSQESAIRYGHPGYTSQIETVLITDFSKRESFTDALEGVDTIFHLASPMLGVELMFGTA
ncbi:hypothetical protein N7532_002635 [Penicillium argentinense]|uniref:NAD-dependent epimerase/dehydratase domain-containing protein n=1 Tax=Penicillium argentinense TaxID=1131581 RepID=A0A9W9G0Q9_9EURO|nr:uncharacterized protein N7532_002635 [Penicillium argentinense]KAJ5109990.1 hypothetical protein N7532_002635 [Penicillium argentinense]